MLFTKGGLVEIIVVLGEVLAAPVEGPGAPVAT
jgi:hypothetical protein